MSNINRALRSYDRQPFPRAFAHQAEVRGPYDFGNSWSVPAHIEVIKGRPEVVRDDGKPLTYYTFCG